VALGALLLRATVPAAGEAMVIGGPGRREAPQQRLDRLLLQPLRGGS
jgi:hypothetical protein